MNSKTLRQFGINRETNGDYYDAAEPPVRLSGSVSTQTWVHTIKKTRIVAGFQDIY